MLVIMHMATRWVNHVVLIVVFVSILLILSIFYSVFLSAWMKDLNNYSSLAFLIFYSFDLFYKFLYLFKIDDRNQNLVYVGPHIDGI